MTWKAKVSRFRHFLHNNNNRLYFLFMYASSIIAYNIELSERGQVNALFMMYLLLSVDFGLLTKDNLISIDKEKIKSWKDNFSTKAIILNIHPIAFGYFYLFLISAFSLFYFSLGLTPGHHFEASDIEITSWVDPFYFSVVTITTLGYGDITPISDMAKVLTATQSLSGVLVMGLFLWSIAIKREERNELIESKKLMNEKRIFFDNLSDLINPIIASINGLFIPSTNGLTTKSELHAFTSEEINNLLSYVELSDDNYLPDMEKHELQSSLLIIKRNIGANSTSIKAISGSTQLNIIENYAYNSLIQILDPLKEKTKGLMKLEYKLRPIPLDLASDYIEYILEFLSYCNGITKLKERVEADLLNFPH